MTFFVRRDVAWRGCGFQPQSLSRVRRYPQLIVVVASSASYRNPFPRQAQPDLLVTWRGCGFQPQSLSRVRHSLTYPSTRNSGSQRQAFCIFRNDGFQRWKPSLRTAQCIPRANLIRQNRTALLKVHSLIIVVDRSAQIHKIKVRRKDFCTQQITSAEVCLPDLFR